MHDALYAVQKIIIAYLSILFVCQFIYIWYANESDFFRVGPSATLVSAGIHINTWPKWSFLMVIVSSTQIVKVLADETISPWIINNVMDEKHEILRGTTEAKIQGMCQLYYLFSGVVGFLKVIFYTTQIDAVIVLISLDCLISYFTTKYYLQNKTIVTAHTPPSTVPNAIIATDFMSHYNTA